MNRKLLTNREIIVNKDITLKFLYIEINKKTFLDIYSKNKKTNNVSFICRLKLSELNYDIGFSYNNNYFIIYKYRPILYTSKNEVIDIIKFYEFDNEMNRIDSYQNLVNRFNSLGGNLVVNQDRAQKKYYDKYAINRDLKNTIMSNLSYDISDKNIKKLLTDSFFNDSENINNKVIDLNPYLCEDKINIKCKNNRN